MGIAIAVILVITSPLELIEVIVRRSFKSTSEVVFWIIQCYFLKIRLLRQTTRIVGSIVKWIRQKNRVAIVTNRPILCQSFIKQAAVLIITRINQITITKTIIIILVIIDRIRKVR